jgi:L-amino acid N-acyltransferase
MKTAIRDAQIGDLPAIRDIYNEAVRNTTATFDTEPRSLEAQEAWFREHGPEHPVLVLMEDGRVIGWASLSPYSDRKAYAGTVENSVYVGEAFRGRGAGTALLTELIDRARRTGRHAIIAKIAQDNPASIRLHRAAGFIPVGTLREVGLKFGRLLDVDLLELIL